MYPGVADRRHQCLKKIMPRGGIRAAVAVRGDSPVANVRRMTGENLDELSRKMGEKDERTFMDGGVLFVHRCKKRPHLSEEQKIAVCYCKLIVSLPQQHGLIPDLPHNKKCEELRNWFLLVDSIYFSLIDKHKSPCHSAHTIIERAQWLVHSCFHVSVWFVSKFISAHMSTEKTQAWGRKKTGKRPTIRERRFTMGNVFSFEKRWKSRRQWAN